jgi:predicted ester cyclase
LTRASGKVIVRTLIEGLDAHDLDVIDRVVAETFVDHTPGPDSPTRVAGRDGIKAYFRAYLRSFPDLRLTLRELLAEDDKVVAYVRVDGTHQGEFLGLRPTGRRTSTNWMMLFRLADGRITEAWDLEDELTLLRQIGVSLVQSP